MAFDAFIQYRWQQSSDFVQSTSTSTNTGLIEVAETVAASGSTTITVAYDPATATSIYVQCDQDGTTMNPTSGTSATLTFADSTVPYVWQTDSQFVNVWGDTFAAILVTNGSASDACSVNIRIQYTV